jgi:hypothetical protein
MGQALPLDETPSSAVVELSAHTQNTFGALIPYTAVYTNRQTEYGGSKFHHPFDASSSCMMNA